MNETSTQTGKILQNREREILQNNEIDDNEEMLQNGEILQNSEILQNGKILLNSEMLQNGSTQGHENPMYNFSPYSISSISISGDHNGLRSMSTLRLMVMEENDGDVFQCILDGEEEIYDSVKLKVASKEM